MNTNPIVALPKTLHRPPEQSRRSGWHVLTAGLALVLCALTLPAQAGSSSLVIAEIYGSGGNSTSSSYRNDYIVIYNRSTAAVDVSGWSVQYASSTGSSWQVTPLSSVSKLIPSGGYFLVQEASSTATSTPALPTPDATGTINLSGSAGKIALCNSTTALSGACPKTSSSLVDLVGFGGANCFEGSAAAPAPSNTTATQRNNGGCTDNDDNVSDFVATTCNPRNSASPTYGPCPTAVPPVIITQPQAQSVWTSTNVSFTVVAGGDPVLSYTWYRNGTQLNNDSTHIGGATTATLWLTNVTTADNGTYTVKVRSSTTPPDVTSDGSAVLTVTYPNPTIVYQPQSQTDLRHSTAALTVAAQGVPSFNTNYTFTYQWQKNVGGTWAPLAEGGQITGSTGKVLQIANFDDANIGDYRVIVTSVGAAGSLSTTSDPATLSVADTGTLVTWDFNNPDMDPSGPAPSQGDARATTALAGSANGFQNGSGDGNDSGVPNNYWGSSSYPNQYVLNKFSGVQFRVSTVGYKDVVVSFSDKASNTGSKYARFQYTTNGSTFIDYPTCFTNYTSFNPQTFDLTGFPNVRNNPNFGFRLVTEFESTAIGTANAVYVAAASTYTYGSSGTLNYDLVKVSVAPATGNTPPTISGLANVVVKDTSPTATVNFTVTPAAGATITSVTATSLNPAIAADPTVSGSYSLALNGYGTDGQAPILVTATDSNGEKTTAWFTFTVNPPNIAPTVTGYPFLTNTLVNTALTVPITVTDDNTASDSLMVSAVSSNATVASASVSADLGSGLRNVTVTPTAGAAGVVPVSIIATDGSGLSSTNSFVVIVRPSTAVVMNDFFDYAPGAIVSNSFGLWLNHSGSYGQMDVVNGNNLYVYSGDGEDVHVPLIGAPYMHTDDSVTLYSSFIVSFNTAPGAGGSYFAHFRDENSGAMTGFSARLWANNDNAATGKFRLGIGNGSGATADNIVQFPMDLSVNTPYLVVTRYVPNTGVSTLWINPTSESSTSVTATDAATPGSAPNQIDVTSYGFRQANSGEGNKHIDSLRIGTSFAAVLPSAAHIDNLAGTTLAYSAGLGARYVLQSNTTGLQAPVWTRVATNATSPGSFSIPTVGSSAGPVFYRIQSE